AGGAGRAQRVGGRGDPAPGARRAPGGAAAPERERVRELPLRREMSELVYTPLRPELAVQCGALELLCFPHAEPADLISTEDFRAYARVFPEGFFVCLDGDRVVGQGGGILLDFDFSRPQHSIVEITGEHQCGNHDPEGGWYYGTDIVVHPEYRRRGIGQRLYDLRKGLVRRLGPPAVLAGGPPPRR